MDVVSVLNKSRYLQKELKALLEIKDQYEALANSIPGGNYDEPRVQKSRSNRAPFARWIDKIMAIDKKIEEKTAELDYYDGLILEAIEILSDLNQRKIIISKFLSLKSWADISKEFYISITTARRWYYDALKIIEKSVTNGQIWTSLDKLWAALDIDIVKLGKI